MKKRKTPDLEKYLEGKKRRFVNYTQGAKIYKIPICAEHYSVSDSVCRSGCRYCT